MILNAVARFGELPRWLQVILLQALGAAITTAAWAGGWWGLVALAAMFGLVLVTLALGEAAIEEAEAAHQALAERRRQW